VAKLSLVHIAVLAIAFLGDRPSLRDWGGIALVAAGVLVLALKR
jgi:transporter family protein